MNEARQEIKKLSELLKIVNLTIPPYQRPYKWTEKNVIQLLGDIFEFVNVRNKEYRIGNIILHNDGKGNNVVDGQQRLTTISILLKQLDAGFNGLMLNEKYKHSISKNNIVYNFRIIDKWLNTNFGDEESKSKLKDKIFDKCEFVLFTVYNQDEAFQLFDSQNARGKALEPYDLLKAFHLREMDFDSEDDRTNCIENWENSVDNGTLKPILGNHLFKIRKWSKNERKYDFTKDDIDEFKGISLHQKQQYPYESAMRIIDGFVENANKDKFLRNLQIAQTFPFQITSPIINGKRFFEYVDFYITQREKLFDYNKEDSIKPQIPEFVKFYEEYCFGYKGCWRSGDKKVRNIYENILMAFVDKFGYVEDFENFYKSFYKLCYNIRCNQKRITVESILNSDAKKVLSLINDSNSPINFKSYQYKTYKINFTKIVNDVEKIANFIDDFNLSKKIQTKLEQYDFIVENLENGIDFKVFFTFKDEKLPFFIKKDWYGFGNKSDYSQIDEQEFVELTNMINQLEIKEKDDESLAFKRINSLREQIDTILDETVEWLSKLK